MGTVRIGLMFRLSIFWIKAITMATYHLKTGRYIPHFHVTFLIFILSFREIFSYFATL